jgi:hypothetical protein
VDPLSPMATREHPWAATRRAPRGCPPSGVIQLIGSTSSPRLFGPYLIFTPNDAVPTMRNEYS